MKSDLSMKALWGLLQDFWKILNSAWKKNFFIPLGFFERPLHLEIKSKVTKNGTKYS